jgi:teichuronic acid biosynthesis glycosyltransferase TuaC
MRVLWLTWGYPSDADPAMAPFLRAQAEALVRAGAEVTVVAPVPWIPPGLGRLAPRWNRYAAAPAREETRGVTVLRPPYLTLPRNFAWGWPDRAMTAAVAGLRLPPPELVHGHFAFPTGTAAVALARAWGVPSLLTLHGSDVTWYPELNPRARQAFLETVHGAGQVVAVSHTLAERTAALTERLPAVLPIGIDLCRFSLRGVRAEARRLLALPEDAFVIAFIGRLTPEKGVDVLLEAVAGLPEPATLLLVGDGPLLAQAQRAPGVVAAGVQPHAAIPRYLAAADLLVLPSLREGLPTVLVEAGAMGVPVVASAVGGVPELLDEERGYLVPPGAVDALRDAITHVRAHPADTRRRAERLQACVAERYDVDRNARLLLSQYLTLVKGAAPVGA